MSATSSLGRLRSLSREERRVLAHAIVLLPLAAAGLRTIGLRRTQALLLRIGRRRTHRMHMDPRDVARLVALASRRGLFRAKCLPSALTLQSLLIRCGAAAELRLGVRKLGAGIEAHAWVEHEGVALLEAEGVRVRFSAFETPITAASRPGA